MLMLVLAPVQKTKKVLPGSREKIGTSFSLSKKYISSAGLSHSSGRSHFLTSSKIVVG